VIIKDEEETVIDVSAVAAIKCEAIMVNFNEHAYTKVTFD
jgi:hypothetical protein